MLVDRVHHHTNHPDAATSMDQVLAQRLGDDTVLPSLVLGCERPGSGFHESSYSRTKLLLHRLATVATTNKGQTVDVRHDTLIAATVWERLANLRFTRCPHRFGGHSIRHHERF